VNSNFRGSQIGTGSRKGYSGGKGSFAMTSMATAAEEATGRREKANHLRSQNHDMDDTDFRPDRGNNQANVTHGKSRRTTGDASSIDSNESTKMIIRKEVQWQVDSEGSRTQSQSDMYR